MPSLFFKTDFPWQTLPASVTNLSRQLLLLTISLCFATQAVAGPRVDVIVGPKATELERFAAAEVAVQFKKLFDADVKVSEQVPAEAGSLILIGSPTTNPALASLAATWPKLSDQGHLVRSIKLGDRQALVAGGGSPVATLWAVYELGHHFGVRYALYGDMYPGEHPTLKLDGIDLLLEPTLRSRTWRTLSRSPIGSVSWGLAEHEQLIRQLAKLKFNRLVLSFEAWQPYVDFEFQGIKKETGVLWPGEIPVDGDTAGRTVFHGAKFFENPDFVGKKTYAERVAAATQQARGILAAGQKVGMSTGIAINPLEMAMEFTAKWAGSRPEKATNRLSLSRAIGQTEDPILTEYVNTQLRAYLQTYPQINSVSFSLCAPWTMEVGAGIDRQGSRTSADLGWIRIANDQAGLRFFSRMISDKQLRLLPDGRSVQFTVDAARPDYVPIFEKVVSAGNEVLTSIGPTTHLAAKKRAVLKTAPTKTMTCNLLLPLSNETVGVLPQMPASSMKSLVDDLRAAGWSGFELNCSTIGDMDFNAYYLSRASFQSDLTITQALTDMLTPVVGEASAARTLKAFEQIEEATTLIDENAYTTGALHPQMLLAYYETPEPVPEWLTKAQGLYYSAMNEMYRVNTRAREGNRNFSLYLARRFEFGGEYLGCLIAARKAGIAKAKGDTETQAAELEKAVESLNSALNALAAVARSNSDRGVIAVLNEYGYRPLKKELEAE